LAIAGRRLIGYNMAQLYSIVTPNLTGTKLSLDSLYELALSNIRIMIINSYYWGNDKIVERWVSKRRLDIPPK
ncbi:MAG: hypothetical protein MGG37_20230, partial [Trichodesmium sp. MAG_R01]|nr:hypothetical protein [Trichodesmium sp. MAG_R01]